MALEEEGTFEITDRYLADATSRWRIAFAS